MVRVEYSDIGERKIVKTSIPGSSRESGQVEIEVTPATIVAPPSSPIKSPPAGLEFRIQHTTNVLRALLEAKLSRDETATGTPPSMVMVVREYFSTSFGITSVGKEKMQGLFDAVKELHAHSSFLRVISQTIGCPDLDSLVPGRSAVYFSIWSIKAGRDENKNDISVIEFDLIVQEACFQFLSVPEALLVEIENGILQSDEHYSSESAAGHIVDFDDAQERVVNLLKPYDRCCLEVDELLFSAAALPQDILTTTGSSKAVHIGDRRSRNKAMVTSLTNLKKLLDECILHDAARCGYLPISTMVDILVVWPRAISRDIPGDEGKARLLAECFLDEIETSAAYIELISFVHERIIEATEIASVDDILDTLRTFERGVDGTTYKLLIRYIDNAILDNRTKLGREHEERSDAKNTCTASSPENKTQKKYDTSKALLGSIGQSKTPLHIAEQHLYHDVD